MEQSQEAYDWESPAVPESGAPSWQREDPRDFWAVEDAGARLMGAALEASPVGIEIEPLDETKVFSLLSSISTSALGTLAASSPQAQKLLDSFRMQAEGVAKSQVADTPKSSVKNEVSPHDTAERHPTLSGKRPVRYVAPVPKAASVPVAVTPARGASAPRAERPHSAASPGVIKEAPKVPSLAGPARPSHSRHTSGHDEVGGMGF